MARSGKRSAGLLLHRVRDGQIEVLLAHMGGPFWAKKDDGAWSLPKGEYEPAEDALTAARREFAEEMGSSPPAGPAVALGELRQPSGKVITAWALHGDFDPTTVRSNTFEIEWPPRSGRRQSFPEVDRVEWFALDTARQKLVRGQVPFLDLLVQRTSHRPANDPDL
ncbi:MAG TPA: NUDIX domain-containing protein [Solirubrobacteraceae bacterium]|nr:NUDIX domain-containing protein [Solirubrobacteraceae bacterium]